MPSTLTVTPGESVEFDVTLSFTSGSSDLYRYGSLTWVSGDHRVRSPIVVRPVAVDAPIEVTSTGTSGSLTFPVDFGYTGSYTPRVTGLQAASQSEDIFVENDPTKTFSFRDGGGVRQVLPPFFVPEDQLFLRFELRDELTDGDDDLDMYLYYCPPEFLCTDSFGNAIANDFFQVAQSGEATSDERIDVFLPLSGVYLILVHGFATDDVSGGPGANFSLLAWQLAPADNAGNMSATGPANASAGSSADISVDWSGLAAPQDYLGGIEHITPDGLGFFTVISITN